MNAAEVTGGPPSKKMAPAPYDSSIPQMGYRVFQTKEEFEMVDAWFKQHKDVKGDSMWEIARKYWDDPEFQEQQRKEIEEKRRRRGR